MPIAQMFVDGHKSRKKASKGSRIKTRQGAWVESLQLVEDGS